MKLITDANLKGLAYRMLGSMADVEDVLQDAALKLHLSEIQPDSEPAFLYRMVSNLCLDRLRKQKREREHYPGPWLPDLVNDDSFDPAHRVEDLDIALMTLMDSLPPGERIAYVLSEAFDFRHAEIAEILEISNASARQRVHRARERLKDAELSPPASHPLQKRLLDELISCVSEGDSSRLVGLMSEDTVALTDGGGIVSAAIIPVEGAQRIAQVMMHLARKGERDGPFQFQLTRMNGSWGLVIIQNGEVHSAATIAIDQNRSEGVIRQVFVIRNPNKLKHLQHYAEHPS